MKKRTVVTTLKMAAVAFALAGLGAAAPAGAEDGKIYPGSMCVKWSGPNPSYNFSAIRNPSSSSAMYLDCPAVKDTIYNSIHDAKVTVLDRHYSQDVRCQLISVYRNTSGGFTGWFSPNRYSSGSSTSPQNLYFGSLGANSSAHYYFSCRVPTTYSGNSSEIVSYRVDEN